ncbi:MAG: DNA gyrase inhibitor YacG [Devosiaceae bacterium]
MSQTRTKTPCPVCSKPLPAAPANDIAPFCSKRCKDVDLNRWLSGSYFIPGNQAGDDSEGMLEPDVTSEIDGFGGETDKTRH